MNNVATRQAAIDAELAIINDLVARAEEIIGPEFRPASSAPRKRYVHWPTVAVCVAIFLGVAVYLFVEIRS